MTQRKKPEAPTSPEFRAWLEAEASAPVLDPRDRKLHAAQQRALELDRQVKAMQAELDQSEERVRIALSLGAPMKALKPIKYKRKSMVPGVPVLMASDWHVEETVDPATVNGRNEYNPKIAAKRAESFFVGADWLIDKCRSGWDIREAVLWLGGDMISGYIHEELMESNSMSPTEALLFCQRIIADGIKFLLDQTGLEQLHVPCSFGNHGRTTIRRRHSTGAKNSYEWLMYHALAREFASDDRVEFFIADGSHLYTDVLGRTIRWHHGDDVKYYGGVGGLSIPMRKAADAWDDFQPADITVIGHWHQFADFGDVVVNGSLIGYNAFALSIKARFEQPRQGFFLIDQRYGKRIVTPIYVAGDDTP